MRFLNGNLKAQKIIFELKPRPLLARLRYFYYLKTAKFLGQTEYAKVLGDVLGNLCMSAPAFSEKKRKKSS